MIEVKQVQTKKELKRFIRLPWKVYKGDPYWVPPLLFEQKGNAFNKKKADTYQQKP